MKILLTGRNGQLGFELSRTLANLGVVTAVDVDEVDLRDTDSIRACFAAVKPDLVVHPAAYTAVDKAEEEKALATAVNEIAVAVLGECCAKAGVPILHYSTDFVFNGESRRPYLETDTPSPCGHYGASKLAGERALAASGAPQITLRTSWLYSLHGKSFLLTIRRLAREREELHIVDDQIGSPTWARLLAEGSAQIVAQGQGDLAGFFRQHAGLYHYSGSGTTSWCGFARAIVTRLAKLETLRAKDAACVNAITTAEYPTPARRPAYSVLDCGKIGRVFGIHPPLWERQLDLCLG